MKRFIDGMEERVKALDAENAKLTAELAGVKTTE